MPTTEIRKDTVQKIIDTFTHSLRQHLFSDHDYPQEVTIRTMYKGCTQTLTIKFGDETQEET